MGMAITHFEIRAPTFSATALVTETERMSSNSSYTQDRETAANTPAAATALLGSKLPVKPTGTAERVRASLILCPAR
jgi:hypothetical protein